MAGGLCTRRAFAICKENVCEIVVLLFVAEKNNIAAGQLSDRGEISQLSETILTI